MMSNSSSDKFSSVTSSFKPYNNIGALRSVFEQIGEFSRNLSRLSRELHSARREIDFLKSSIAEYSHQTSISKARNEEMGIEKELIQALQVIDRDQIGCVSADQLRYVMKSLDFYDDEVDEMISYAIMDDKDQIKHEELAKFIADNGLQLISRP